MVYQHLKGKLAQFRLIEMGSLSFGVVKLTRITSHHRPMTSLTAGNSREIRFLMGRKNGFASFTTGFLREPKGSLSFAVVKSSPQPPP
jgi:hypothetical protein